MVQLLLVSYPVYAVAAVQPLPMRLLESESSEANVLIPLPMVQDVLHLNAMQNQHDNPSETLHI